MNELSTQDINLAVYLDTNGVKLVNITPVVDNTRKVYFNFVDVPASILNSWIENTPTKEVINSYRHLRRAAQQVLNGLEPSQSGNGYIG